MTQLRWPVTPVGSARPVVAVLIPTRDNVDELAQCLESLRALRYPPERLELLVFDNGSAEPARQRAAALCRGLAADGWRRVSVPGSPRNLGAFGDGRRL